MSLPPGETSFFPSMLNILFLQQWQAKANPNPPIVPTNIPNIGKPKSTIYGKI